jgi:glutamyl-tRNA reductase
MDDLLHVGMTYRTAGLELRECLARHAPETPGLLADLADLAAQRVILRTCGRFEVYATGCAGGGPAICERVAAWADLPVARVSPGLTVRSSAAAARHLLEVAAGLDSRILGEDQVLAQVRRAFELAQQARSSGPVLSALFQTAIHTGRQVRHHTSLTGGCGSLAQAAVRLAIRETAFEPDDTVLVLGTGLMAEQTLAHVPRDLGPRVTVVSRHVDRASRLAAALGLQAAALEQLAALLPRCRVLISCTSAPRFLLTPAMLAERRRHLLAIDLGMPRTLDPDCAAQSRVVLRHLDEIPDFKAASEEARRQAQTLVAAGCERFRLWCGGRRAARHIRDLLQQADGRQPAQARAIRRAVHPRLLHLKEHAA